MPRLALAAGLLLAVTAVPAAAAPQACRGVPAYGSDGRATHLEATRDVTCRFARSMVRGWRNNNECYYAEACDVRRYSCEERGDQDTTTVTCRRGGGRRISWRQHLD